MIQYLIGNATQISISDPVSPQDDEEPSFGSYFTAEDSMLRFVRSLLSALGSEETTVREPLLGIPQPDWLPDFRNGVHLSLDQSLRLLRCSLRGVPIGCRLLLIEDGSVQISADFNGLLRVDAHERHESVITSLLPPGLEIFAGQPTQPPESMQDRVADEGFWQSVKDLLLTLPLGILVIERWADGIWGETWRLATIGTIDQVRRSIRENSLVIVHRLPELEEITLSERFDETSVLVVDQLDLRYFLASSLGPDLGIKPLTSAAVAADPSLWDRPIRIVSFPYSDPAPQFVAVAPSLTTNWMT